MEHKDKLRESIKNKMLESAERNGHPGSAEFSTISLSDENRSRGKNMENDRQRRKADLSPPYKQGDKWCVVETLYPESRGYLQHSFDTQDDADKFIRGAK